MTSKKERNKKILREQICQNCRYYIVSPKVGGCALKSLKDYENSSKRNVNPTGTCPQWRETTEIWKEIF
jgi:hypothetical protein